MIQLKYIIPDKWRNINISQILRKELHFSATLMRGVKAIPNSVCLDGTPTSLYLSPEKATTLTVLLPDDDPSPIEPIEGPLDILFEDEHLLILNKHPHVVVHPGSGHHGNTLGNYVMYHYRDHGESHLYRPVNRLDKGTSGIMCIAKHAYIADLLRMQLHSGAFKRTYLAICQGKFLSKSGEINAPIGRKDGSVIEREVRADGHAALTRYRVLSFSESLTLAEAEPVTGRTHQIRVHMASLGHPLIGDFLYGVEDHSVIDRPALHSFHLELHHPITGEQLSLFAPLPDDFKTIMASKKLESV